MIPSDDAPTNRPAQRQMTLYHFPGCPYSERVEILLALKDLAALIRDVEIDISSPRPAWLLQMTRGSTALPVLEIAEGTLRESLVILRYLDVRYPERQIVQSDPYRHAIESMLVATDSAFTIAGYQLLRNRDPAKRDELRRGVDAQFARLDQFLRDYGSSGPYLFDDFGWAEVVFTPLIKRLRFLEYYESYEIPKALTRVRRWQEACLAHPSAQRRTHEEIVKLYYDYSLGVGSGAIPPGRQRSSFTMDPHWSGRPMPPRDKWGPSASDAELGLGV